MTRKSDFNAEEWARLVEGPALAGMAVMAAERGGTLREAVSMAQVYAEARRDQQRQSELLDELVSSPPALDPQRFRSPDDVSGQAIPALREAVGLLETKATPEEVEDYKRFTLALAQHVARAHREGGFLGVGGKEVSDAEQAAVDQIGDALGVAPG